MRTSNSAHSLHAHFSSRFELLHFYQAFAFEVRVKSVHRIKWTRSILPLYFGGWWTTISYLRTRIIVLFRSMNTHTHTDTHPRIRTLGAYRCLCVHVSCSIDEWEIHCIWQFLQIDWFQWEFAETCCNCTNEMDCSIQAIYISIKLFSFRLFCSLHRSCAMCLYLCRLPMFLLLFCHADARFTFHIIYSPDNHHRRR